MNIVGVLWIMIIRMIIYRIGAVQGSGSKDVGMKTILGRTIVNVTITKSANVNKSG